jgi:broad specificity phosphatase PhoE
VTLLTILLLRHGQTDWNHSGRWQGHADIPLNETGQKQAEALCQRLRSWPIDTIYTSDLQRCVQTAVPLAAELGIEPIKKRCGASEMWATLAASRANRRVSSSPTCGPGPPAA